MSHVTLIPIVGIIAGVCIVAVVVLGLIIIAGMILRARSKRPGGAMNQDEMRMVQEIHAGLDRMEKRIEALEAILMEQMKAR